MKRREVARQSNYITILKQICLFGYLWTSNINTISSLHFGFMSMDRGDICFLNFEVLGEEFTIWRAGKSKIR